MKHILVTFVGAVAIGFVLATTFSIKPEVTTPEVKQTGSYERPVKDGNCWIQTDTAGNKIRVCH